MDKVYKEAFAEVLEVLKNSDPKIVDKISEKFITLLKQNKDDDYIVKIDFTDANWEDSIKEETKYILALIYRDYIVSSEEREKLLLEEEKEQIKIENELKEKYNLDNIFKKRESITELQNLENNEQLIKVEKYPWYKKLFYQALKVLRIKK